MAGSSKFTKLKKTAVRATRGPTDKVDHIRSVCRGNPAGEKAQLLPVNKEISDTFYSL